MNTAMNDTICFSSSFAVICDRGATYIPCDSEHAAHVAAQYEVLEGYATVASVYRATDSGVAEHVTSYDLATDEAA